MLSRTTSRRALLSTAGTALLGAPLRSVCAAVPMAPVPIAAHPGAIQQAALLKKMPPEILNRIMGSRPNDAGLVGVNAQKWEDIGNQRGAMLPLGVWAIRGDREKADAQWRAVEVGFQHQESDGRFAGSRTPSSIAFFFCELCDALLLVRASPLADAYEERIAALLPKIRLGVQRMHAERDKLWRFDIHAPNRLLFTAQAFGLSGLLLDDKELLALANDFAMAALSFQRKSDGVFLENFGPDTSYHAVCLLRAQVYGFFFPQKRIDEAMEKGIAWERSRILPTGEVDVTGNVRTGLGQEVYHGKPKGVNYGEVVLALLYYAARTGDSGTLADARRIAAYRYRTPV